ncbi:hypothetical protein BEWA_001830 [Theileria equi strain WA]|uniref:Calmodulin n=1 Tax=Theileria equi strain WA TaxID=1537102 RepID=L0B0I7_THEEQ|nr:hypothetical protein BEWA_001830 [Theileria equi strain WA]AFZ80776.1 hypothetical protein BEWA_001830 [Theileria equi strain WA]|eukprot:XP_004830442.1 hypothetical protein BEWA_001830 [Theileria equi strain WA]
MELHLKSGELLDLFKSFDSGNKGALNRADLSHIFANVLGNKQTDEEIQALMQHIAGKDIQGNDVEAIDFAMFKDLVNNTLKNQPIEAILRGPFKKISGGKGEVTIDELLDFAGKAGIESGSDAKVRLMARMPDGKANFEEFCKCVANG